MIIKPRLESEELKIYHSLNERMALESSDQQHYYNLKKGYEGEVAFDKMLNQLYCENLILCDIWLEVQNSFFQIDTLLILPPNTIYAFEVKNFEGDFYIEKGNWFSTTKGEIKNPLNQVERSESLFRRYLQKLNSSLNLKYNTIFINPEFTLYQAPQNKAIIFPTQLKRFLKNLDSSNKKLTSIHRNHAQKILADKCPKPPYQRIPAYQYDQLLKGILCANCHSIATNLGSGEIFCKNCGTVEDIDSAILRSVEEFSLLFPSQKITTNGIHDWCQLIESKKTIRRVLSKNFSLTGHGKTAHFIKQN